MLDIIQLKQTEWSGRAPRYARQYPFEIDRRGRPAPIYVSPFVYLVCGMVGELTKLCANTFSLCFRYLQHEGKRVGMIVSHYDFPKQRFWDLSSDNTILCLVLLKQYNHHMCTLFLKLMMFWDMDLVNLKMKFLACIFGMLHD